MLDKVIATHVVVISSQAIGGDYYRIKLGDAEGEIYKLTIHEEIILDYRLVVGKELDKETFNMLQNSEDYQKAYSYAIGILARRMYTEKEIRRKLYERKTADDIVEDVVAKLFEIGVLNDATYARVYIENQLEMGKKSKRQIISDLYSKGILTNIVDDLMDLFEEASEIALIKREIEKMYRRYLHKDLSDFELRKRIIQSLGRKGFEINEVQRQYEFFIEDLTVEEDE